MKLDRFGEVQRKRGRVMGYDNEYGSVYQHHRRDRGTASYTGRLASRSLAPGQEALSEDRQIHLPPLATIEDAKAEVGLLWCEDKEGSTLSGTCGSGKGTMSDAWRAVYWAKDARGTSTDRGE